MVEKILTNFERKIGCSIYQNQIRKIECECLAHRITLSGTSTLVRKAEPIDKLKSLKRLSEVDSFKDINNSLHNYLPALISAPSNPFLVR